MSENKPFILTDDPQPQRGSKYHLLLILFLSLIVVVLVFYFIGIFKVKEKIEKYTTADTTALLSSEFMADDEYQEDSSLMEESTDSSITATEKATGSEEPGLTQPSTETSAVSSKVPPKAGKANPPVVAQEQKSPETESIQTSSGTAPSGQTLQAQADEYWYIIVNSFRGLYYAKKQIASISRLGYTAFYRSIKVKEGDNQGTWYKVYVGPFTIKSELNQASARIKEKQKQNQVFVIRSKKLLN